MDEAKKYLDTGGCRIHYWLYKPGRHRRLLVLIHGMASNLSRWSEFIESTSLTDTWDVMRIDLRGHGYSVFRGAIGFHEWSTDLCEILDLEKYQKVVLVGHSLGAQQALYFAANYPSRSGGIALIDPVFHKALYPFYKWIYRLRFLIMPVIAGISLLNKLGIHRSALPIRDLRKLDEETRKRLAESGDTEEFVKNYSSPWPDLKQFPVNNYLKELVETLRPIKGINNIRVPILAILAKAPTYTDPEKTQEILRRLHKCEINEIHAFHWPLTEQPEETREAIENWCEQQFRDFQS